jgi:cytochrome c-type biogenesis protein
MGIVLILSLTGKYMIFAREFKFHRNFSKLKHFGAVIAGAAFAFGWTPCIGTVLASILAIAADKKSLFTGATLLTAYSLGLAVPFVLFSLILEQATGVLNFLKRYSKVLALIGGLLMIVLGVLIFNNRLTLLNSTI